MPRGDTSEPAIAGLDREVAALRRAVEIAARAREVEDDRRNREDPASGLYGEAARAARLAAFSWSRLQAMAAAGRAA